MERKKQTAWKRKLTVTAILATMATASVQSPLLTVYAEDNNGKADDFAAQIAGDYAQPEMKYRPYARWWLAEGSHTDETLKESVQELYDDGYGGIEFVTLDESQYLDKETYAWGSPEWIHDTKVIIEECNRLGMSVSMTSGTHWSTANLVSITPDEEAASQGLIAGINAARKLQGKEGIVIDRSQGYIGVLIDDLVTKESHEPYRMMTSRAEYRLLLRQDNADIRLTKIGYEVGLIDEERYQKLLKKEEMIEKEIERVEHTNVGTTEAVQALLESYESTPLTSGTTLAELIRRPELSYEKIAPIDKHREELPYDVKEQVDINIKYDGYIKRQMRQVEQFKKLENKRIPENINYDEIQSLRLEAKQKLNQIRPSSIGQASRISGVSPADVSVLLVYLSSK